VPVKPGVYLLWVNYKNGDWGCFYVGKGDTIRGRLLDHLKQEEENQCIKEKVGKKVCGFMWIEITTEEERTGVEKYLYDTLKPKPECNQNDPGGKPLPITLLPTPPATAPSV
jgi:excinuclease UvrABC nuclease subunit